MKINRVKWNRSKRGPALPLPLPWSWSGGACPTAGPTDFTPKNKDNRKTLPSGTAGNIKEQHNAQATVFIIILGVSC